MCGLPKNFASCHTLISWGFKKCLYRRFGSLFGFGVGIRYEQCLYWSTNIEEHIEHHFKFWPPCFHWPWGSKTPRMDIPSRSCVCSHSPEYLSVSHSKKYCNFGTHPYFPNLPPVTFSFFPRSNLFWKKRIFLTSIESKWPRQRS